MTVNLETIQAMDHVWITAQLILQEMAVIGTATIPTIVDITMMTISLQAPCVVLAVAV